MYDSFYDNFQRPCCFYLFLQPLADLGLQRPLVKNIQNSSFKV